MNVHKVGPTNIRTTRTAHKAWSSCAERDDEFEALLGLYGHLHSRDESVEASIAKERWQQMQAMPGHEVLGFYHDDGLIGSCVLQIVPNLSRGARPYAVMENVVVHPDHRRRGVGTTMCGRR